MHIAIVTRKFETFCFISFLIVRDCIDCILRDGIQEDKGVCGWLDRDRETIVNRKGML